MASNNASDGSMSLGGRKEGAARLLLELAPGKAGGGGTTGAAPGCLLPIELMRWAWTSDGHAASRVVAIRARKNTIRMPAD
jgi:hypothetical protein